ncbi:hypothetical protein [Streptomyces lunalinharesii]|uniref:Uncharacterized protein n=1 Tax=Streptomyces lunalinharesii TaxID=333384 RepID=A0ABN3SVX8_9ACTN
MTRTPSSIPVRATLTTGGLWEAEIVELPEVRPAHRSLSQLQARVRAAIAKAHGTDSGDVELDLTISTGSAEFDAEITAARELRAKAAELEEQARAAAVPLAQRLVRSGVSTRDAGLLLGYSGASVSGMTKSS